MIRCLGAYTKNRRTPVVGPRASKRLSPKAAVVGRRSWLPYACSISSKASVSAAASSDSPSMNSSSVVLLEVFSEWIVQRTPDYTTTGIPSRPPFGSPAGRRPHGVVWRRFMRVIRGWFHGPEAVRRAAPSRYPVARAPRVLCQFRIAARGARRSRQAAGLTVDECRHRGLATSTRGPPAASERAETPAAASSTVTARLPGPAPWAPRRTW